MKAKGKFMGVCATISNKIGIDVFWVRLWTIVLFVCAAPVFILIYFLLGMFACE